MPWPWNKKDNESLLKNADSDLASKVKTGLASGSPGGFSTGIPNNSSNKSFVRNIYNTPRALVPRPPRPTAPAQPLRDKIADVKTNVINAAFSKMETIPKIGNLSTGLLGSQPPEITSIVSQSGAQRRDDAINDANTRGVIRSRSASRSASPSSPHAQSVIPQRTRSASASPVRSASPASNELETAVNYINDKRNYFAPNGGNLINKIDVSRDASRPVFNQAAYANNLRDNSIPAQPPVSSRATDISNRTQWATGKINTFARRIDDFNTPPVILPQDPYAKRPPDNVFSQAFNALKDKTEKEIRDLSIRAIEVGATTAKEVTNEFILRIPNIIKGVGHASLSKSEWGAIAKIGVYASAVGVGSIPNAGVVSSSVDFQAIGEEASKLFDAGDFKSVIPSSLKNISNKAETIADTVGAGLSSAYDYTKKHLPRYSKNDDSTGNAVAGIGSGISDIFAGTGILATSAAGAVVTGVSEVSRLISGRPRDENNPNIGTRFNAVAHDNNTETLQNVVRGGGGVLRGLGKIATGTADVVGNVLVDGTGGLAKFAAVSGRKFADESAKLDEAYKNKDKSYSSQSLAGVGLKKILTAPSFALAGISSAVLGPIGFGIKKLFGQTRDKGLDDQDSVRNAINQKEIAKDPSTIAITDLHKPHNNSTGVAIGTEATARALSNIVTGTRDIAVAIGRGIKMGDTFKGLKEGFLNSWDEASRSKLIRRLSGVPSNVNIEGSFLNKLGFGSDAESYQSIHNIKNAILSLGNSRAGSRGGLATDVVGFIR